MLQVSYVRNYKLLKEVEELREGDFVKLCDNGERFWVEIMRIGVYHFFGRVDNELLNEHSFQFNSLIVFKKEHVYDIVKAGLKRRLPSYLSWYKPN